VGALWPRPLKSHGKKLKIEKKKINESPNKRIKLVDLSADDQLSPDSLEAKMNVNFKNFIFNQPKNFLFFFYNLQHILDAFYKYLN
jgi:hypothetical protein